MVGNLSLQQLHAAVQAGEIDTVLMGITNMQGRLVGKRFLADAHACASPRGLLLPFLSPVLLSSKVCGSWRRTLRAPPCVLRLPRY
jgi:hypothetical protein